MHGVHRSGPFTQGESHSYLLRLRDSAKNSRHDTSLAFSAPQLAGTMLSSRLTLLSLASTI